MPYQIPGVPGTWYEPGTRKGNTTIAWRGRLPDGTWTEFFTDSRHQAGAVAYLRTFLAEWHSRRPPAAGAEDVTVAQAAGFYRNDRKLAPNHPDARRLDFIVAQNGNLGVRTINNAIIRAAAEAWLEGRRRAVDAAIAAGERVPKLPSHATANREVITPYRALLKYAAGEEWRHEIVVRALPAPEGSLPPAPPVIAEDSTVLALLEAIEERIRTAPTRWTREKQLYKRAFVWLCHERGYRISEWMRFDWEWVDLPQATARMAITKDKTNLRWETFELSPTAVAFLSALDARDTGRVFAWHSRSNIYKWADDLIGPELKWRPHESRRAIVSHIVATTGDYKQAGRYVGHASERTTYRYRILGAPELAPSVRFAGKMRDGGVKI